MGYARTGSETSGWKNVKRFALVTSILTSIAVLGRYTLDCSAMFFGANKGEYEQQHNTPFSPNFPKSRLYPANVGISNVITQSGEQSDGKEYGDNLKEDDSLFDFSREKTLAERVYNTFQYGRDAIDTLANANERDSNRGNPSNMENNSAEKSGLEKKVQPDAPLSNPSYQQQFNQPKQPQPTQVKTTTEGYSI